MAVNLPSFPELDLHPRESIPTRFEKYLKRLNNLFDAMEIADPKRKKAMLLHYIGEETCDVFETLTIPDPGEHSDVFKEAVKGLKEHFEPQKCIDHHVYNFRKETQKSGETTGEFYTRLQLLAKKCEFTDVELEIKRQIVQGTSSARLRRKAIEQSLSLDNILKTACAMEAADEQTLEIENQQANALGHKGRLKKGFKKSYERGKFAQPRYEKPRMSNSPPKKYSKSCGLCGGTYPHSGSCPAEGKQCANCKKLNHFARVCRSKKFQSNKQFTKHHVRSVNNEPGITSDESTQGFATSLSCNSEDSEEYTFQIMNEQLPKENVSTLMNDKPVFTLTIEKTPVNLMADSGASVNILNEKDYLSMKSKPPLVKSNMKIYPYMSDQPLKLCGKFQGEIHSDSQSSHETFYVVKGPSQSVLSWKTSLKLNLIQVAHGQSVKEPELPQFLHEFPKVIAGMGVCKGEPVKIHIDESVKPVAQPHRRIPFPVRKQVEEKLLQLEKDDIIERADGPTPWISPIVVVPKPPHNRDEVRICVDMRELNRAIIRERHVIPTLDDVISDLNGCKVFSKLDLKQVYHQILLHPDSRYLTTFSSHIGLWRYERLNFGLSCSAEIFQKKVSDVIAGIPGVQNISDDIYIGGIDQIQHDERLRLVLHKLQDNNLTINPKKCEFRVLSMLFFGHIFSGSGISADPKKVEALKVIPPPKNVTEDRSLLSSAAFCSRYIKNFATITRPLRILTCKDQPWRWEDQEQKSFDDLKAALSAETTLGYFDPQAPTTLYVDGSPIGLGAVLTQTKVKERTVIPLYYASYPLTPTETRYPQIDREALSIFWAIKGFIFTCMAKSLLL